MPFSRQELVDPVTGARLRFVSVGADTVAMELTVDGDWSAGPPHVHPRQTERLRVLDGSFRALVDGRVELVGPGDEVAVPPATAHTIRLAGPSGRLAVEFSPALRTGEMFETMFGAEFPRRPPALVPSPLRAWVESLGFGDEIRYLWPRRVAAVVTALLVGAALATRGSRPGRRARGRGSSSRATRRSRPRGRATPTRAR